MQDLFAHFSEYRQLDPTQSLFELYSAYVEVKGAPEADDLGTFLSWGPTLLRDINDVDNYLLAPIPFFTDLRNIKDIEEWSFGAEKLTADQMRFTKLWVEQGQIYLNFTERTQKAKLATYGGMGRNIASRMDEVLADKRIAFFHFVGSNALSKSEKHLIRGLQRAGKASCLWDVDAHYFENEVHEAGAFLRTNKKELPEKEFKFLERNFEEQEKEIELVSAGNDLAQIQVACSILGELAQKQELEQTVVVLPDQHLLLPLLMNLPDSVERFNVTMGIPLRGTPALELLNALIDLHEKSVGSGKQRFYHKDVKRILKHPLLLKAVPALKYLATDHRAYLAPVDIIPPDAPGELAVFQSYFELDGQIASTLSGILPILDLLATCPHLHVVEREFAVQTQVLWERLIEIQGSTALVQDLRSLQKLTQHLAGEHDVTFIGEPLQGLQIMGVLETRAIDLKRVLYLSMNEGAMPQEDKSNTYIPYDLRMVYGLPTRAERASVQAYNFYRSIQRAEHAYLIYKSEGAGMKAGGPSRFLAQIEHELAERPNLHITRKTQLQQNVEAPSGTLQVEKTEAVQQRLKELLAQGLSPSAMSTFIQCPLDFYYKYVLRIRSAEETLEHLDSSNLGTAVHDTAEALTKPYVGEVLSAELLGQAKKRIPESVRSAFLKAHPHADLDRGKDLLHFEIIQKFMKDYLSREAERCQKEDIVIEALEKPMDSTLTVHVHGETVDVRIHGKADRIDRSGGTHTLIDLKSGSLKNGELKVAGYEDILDKPKIKVLQLLTYAYLLQKSGSHIETMSAGIFPFGNSASGLVRCNIDGQDLLPPDAKERFEELVAEVVHQMLDIDVPFEHNEDFEYCAFCQKN